MRKERNSFSITNHICLHGPLHMVCALFPVPAPTLALDLHAHTQLYCLLLFGQRGGGVEGCMYSNVFFQFGYVP